MQIKAEEQENRAIIHTTNDFNEPEEIEIDLVELFYYLLAHIVPLVLAFILGAILVGAYSVFFIEPKYKASSQIYMVSASSESMVNLSDLNLGTSLSQDYEQVIKIRPIYEELIRNLDLPYSVEQLRGMVDVGVVNNTRVIQITVTDTDPNEARDIANELASITVNQIPKLMDTVEPNLIEMAITPEGKSSPDYTKNALMGGLGFMSVLAGYFVLRFIMDDTVKSEADIETMFGVLPLTSIPEGELGKENTDVVGDEGKTKTKKRRRTRRQGGRKV